MKRLYEATKDPTVTAGVTPRQLAQNTGQTFSAGTRLTDLELGAFLRRHARIIHNLPLFMFTISCHVLESGLVRRGDQSL
jgi:hypothetical protein